MVGNVKYFTCSIYLLNFLLFGFSEKFSGDGCVDALGREGTCRPIHECPIALEGLNHTIIPIHCGFINSDPIVCCPNPIVFKKTTPPPPLGPSSKPGEAAKYYCEQHVRYCPASAYVAGGTKVHYNEFPHMAAIGYGEENKIQWACGGSLISEKFVLTAAHCLHSGQIGPARWVLLGTELLHDPTGNSSDARRGQTHPVMRRIGHPGYKPPSKYHDVALLEIGPAITPNANSTVGIYVHPACLPMKNQLYSSEKAVATGWGRVGFGDSASPHLLKVDLDILEPAWCNETFSVEIRKTDWLQKGIDSTMICAGVLEGGKDTCQGDSGGPLQYRRRNSCTFEIWGVTSFGKFCAFANSPAVYMRVSEYVPWIESVVWPIPAKTLD